MMSMIKIKADGEAAVTVAVIGGGAAGMLAAISAAENGATVTLFERNDKAGRKLGITGKGRCNVTNDCDIPEFLKNVPTNPRFLYAALNGFSPEDTKEFFEKQGVSLKTERGRRVFPCSDRAADIVNALLRRLGKLFVKIEKEKRIKQIYFEADGKEIGGVVCDGEKLPFDAVIIATGGKSYPKTGSDGDGYLLAKSAGHTITPLYPSLVPLLSDDTDKVCAAMQGLSLKNVTLKIAEKATGKVVYSENAPGELMFAHFGLTGPLVLSASAHIEYDDIVRRKLEAVIDLKPALDIKTLDTRIRSDFAQNINKDFCNSLSALLPLKMIDVVVARSGIDPRVKVNSVTAEQRASLVDIIKNFRVSLCGFRPIDEAIITKGGVNVKEIDPKTMQSKLVNGLYFAGEIIDVDAYTGGYNLQIAFSTAVAAGRGAAFRT